MKKLDFFKKEETKKALHALTSCWHLEIGAVLCGIIGITASWIAYPWVLKLLIDEVFTQKNFQMLKFALFLFMGAGIVEIVFSSLHLYLYTLTRQRVIIDLHRLIKDA